MKRSCFFIIIFFTALTAAHDFLSPEKKNHTKSVATERQEKEDKGKRKTDEPGKFLLFHRGIRTRDGAAAPDYPTNYKWNELQEARINQFARRRNGRTKSNGVVEWKERGPGNVPGRTRALYNIPGDPSNNTWLAGAATGGIWRTSNGGTSWTEKSADFPALPISSFAADVNATVIYAGSGEFVSSIYSAAGNGIFKSADKGQSWIQLSSTNNNPDFSIITRLIVHPSNPDLVLATTVPHNLTTDETSAIMRSTDGGATWTKVKEITGAFEQIIAAPNNFNIQYASQNGVGIWKSVDGGLTWNLSNQGMAPNGRVEIAISPVNPNRIFASAEGNLTGQNSDLYYSTDAAVTWSLIDVRFNNQAFDFFEGQGFYDNTIMCDPFNENKVYFGGVSLFRATVTSISVPMDNFRIQESSTQGFLFLQAFANIPYDNNRLDVGNSTTKPSVEVRFGPGESQKAHRFTVPAGATSNVDPNDYSYNDYVNIPFEAWDISNNKQLMVSFRDQNRNGKFDLVPVALDPSDPANTQSREYLYIHDIPYNATTPNADVSQAGGHLQQMMYNIFPALAEDGSWDENNLPVSKLVIKNEVIQKFNATTVTVADGRGSFDNKNKSDQVDLTKGVHPDHHAMVPIIISQTSKTFKIIIGNDGGVFVSKTSTNPGISERDWTFKGLGLNTSQFYGADKKPGEDVYIGGMQDNGTRISPGTETATAFSNYIYALSGDGFEVLWHNIDPKKILGSTYNGLISRTLNGGLTWQDATTGFEPGADFPFVTKLANSKDFPDRVFTIGSKGVYVSDNFGGSWQLTSINEKFISENGSPFFLDVEVSRANANVVWAGTGMFNTGDLRNLHVSVNGGKTFTATNNFSLVTMGNITKLASHPVDEKTAYALFSFAKSPKILRTTDRGQSWEDISGFGSGNASTNGFPDVAVFCLYVRPDNPDIIWVGTEIGIVESLDNGQTWALIDDFPNVSVWDMKGQDDQVVIATHGRGIWTATIDTPQEGIEVPEIIASGTSPSKSLMLRILSTETFDSVQVFVGTDVVKRIKPFSSGSADVELTGISPGEKEIKLVSFKGSAPFQSVLYKTTHHQILDVQPSYANYFNSTQDLVLDGLTLQNFMNVSTTQKKSLHTNHNYSVNKVYQVLVTTPVSVSATLPVLYYSDLAIVQPAQDFVIVEATKNGLDWIPLKPAYDASYAGDVNKLWHTAFSANQPGTSSMLVPHEIDLTDNFIAGDVLLFRWRVVSGPSVTSWGWALDYISIQELPVSLEPLPKTNSALLLYPNPAKGKFTIEYNLLKSSEVLLTITDVFGRTILSEDLGQKSSGINSHTVNIGNVSTGTYMVIVHTHEGKKAGKIISE